MTLNVEEFLLFFDYEQKIETIIDTNVVDCDNNAAKILREVGDGSIDHLRLLAQMVLGPRPNSCSMPSATHILESFMPFLGSEVTPNVSKALNGDLISLRKIEYAIHCIFISNEVIGYSIRSRSIAGLGPNLLSSEMWGPIVEWVDFVVSEVTTAFGRSLGRVQKIVQCCATLLQKLVGFGPSGDMFKVDAACHVCLSLWTYEDSNGKPLVFITKSSNDEGCPIIGLFITWVTSETRGLTQLSSAHTLQQVLQFASARISIILALLALMEITTLSALRGIQSIWRISQKVVENGQDRMSKDNISIVQLELFRKTVSFYKEATEQAMFWSGSRFVSEICLDTSHEIADHVLRFCRPIEAITQAIRGGLLQVVLQSLLQFTSTSSVTYARWMETFKNIVGHTVYAGVRRAAKRSLKDIQDVALRSLTSKHPGYSRAITMLLSMRRHNVLGRQVRGYRKQICDNLMHSSSQNVTLFRQPQESRVCAGCRAAIYCSKECQRQEWDHTVNICGLQVTPHKRECEILRQGRPLGSL